jgi:hypothetical protein
MTEEIIKLLLWIWWWIGSIYLPLRYYFDYKKTKYICDTDLKKTKYIYNACMKIEKIKQKKEPYDCFKYMNTSF